jgi:hypothetical protein
MKRILLRRGLQTDLPILSVGEAGFATDTGKLYIGNNGGNVLVGPVDLTGYATEAYVSDAIADIPVSLDSNNNITLTTEDTFIDDNDEEITVTKQWEFASDGTTYLSKNSFESTTYLSTPINDTATSLEITAGRDIYLRTAGYDSEGGVSTSIAFKFDDEGAITFPDGTVQTTAYTGDIENVAQFVDGVLEVPPNGYIDISGSQLNSRAFIVSGQTGTLASTNSNVTIVSNLDSPQPKTWYFNENGTTNLPGTLLFPDGTVQTTAFNVIDAKDTYGCFHKLASLTAPAANTVYNFDWYTDTTVHESEGVTVTSSNPTRISIAKSGKYSVFTEMIVRINGVGERNVFLWLAKNGTDIPETGVKVSLRQGGADNPVFETLAKQWFLDDINANDYIELRYALNRVDLIQLEYTPAQTEPYIRPAIPSATITIIEV